MTNEVNKLIWPSSDGGIGMIDTKSWANTVKIAMGTKNDTGSTIITAAPPKTAYSNTWVKKALAELKTAGVDTTGSGFTPLTVTLKEGGK